MVPCDVLHQYAGTALAKDDYSLTPPHRRWLQYGLGRHEAGLHEVLFHRPTERLARQELIRLGQRLAGLCHAMPRQGCELRLHRGAPRPGGCERRGVLPHPGSSKTCRAITRGELYTSWARSTWNAGS